MFRSSLLVAVSGLALAACQPAADAPTDLSAETPPVIEETADVVETVEAEIEADVETASEAVEEVAEAAAEAAEEHDHDDEDHAHEGEEHDHDEDHDDHEDHADEHDHDEHAHEEDDHDHDHAGGEAHVHGLSELAASLDGSTLSVNVEGALANFDLDESLRTIEDGTSYINGTVEIIGGDCTLASGVASIRPIDDHGNMVLDLDYECAAPDTLEAIDVTGFQSFAGFEEVNAIFLTETGQTAETLTESDTRLDLN